MGNPFGLSIDVRLGCLDPAFAQKLDEIRNPFDVLLDGNRHVTENGRAARPRYHEHIWESRDLDAKICLGPVGPLFLERQTVPPTDIHLQETACHRVEAGSEDDDVEFELFVLGPNASRRYLLNWRVANINQLNIFAIVCLEVIGVYESTLGTVRMVHGQKFLQCLGILHYFPYLGPDELGGGVVRPNIGADVLKCSVYELHPTVIPGGIISPLALLG